jgi:hypothetical protein
MRMYCLSLIAIRALLDFVRFSKQSVNYPFVLINNEGNSSCISCAFLLNRAGHGFHWSPSGFLCADVFILLHGYERLLSPVINLFLLHRSISIGYQRNWSASKQYHTDPLDTLIWHRIKRQMAQKRSMSSVPFYLERVYYMKRAFNNALRKNYLPSDF